MLDGLTARFAEAGHILGSATVTLTAQPANPGRPVVLCFSGDLGRRDLPILRDPAPLPECDHLIVEATYGNRRHEKPDDMKVKLVFLEEEATPA